MEYFGRNLFVMNILPTSTPRKYMITGYLRAGNGGYPWQTAINRNPKAAHNAEEMVPRKAKQEKRRGMVRPQ
jgi:hypothetical protein